MIRLLRGASSALARLSREISRALLELLLPATCVSCARTLDGCTGPTCRPCAGRLVVEAVPRRCVECSAALSAEAPRCGACRDARRLRVEAPRPHAGVARDLVHALKYGRRRDAADCLSWVTAADPRVLAVVRDAEVLVPVPADPVRRRERGFNTARLVADGLAEAAGARRPRVREVLATRRSRPQVGRSGTQRRSAPRGSMRARWPAWGVRGRRIVLVDDVVTTGATLLEAARVLRRLGAVSVTAVTCTRAEGELIGEIRARSVGRSARQQAPS